MKIKFKRRQRKRIRKFLSGFHGKERINHGSKTIGDYAGITNAICRRHGQ